MSILNGTLAERVKEYFYEEVLIAISTGESEQIASFIRAIVEQARNETLTEPKSESVDL